MPDAGYGYRPAGPPHPRGTSFDAILVFGSRTTPVVLTARPPTVSRVQSPFLPEMTPRAFAYPSGSGHSAERKVQAKRSEFPRKNATAESTHQADQEQAYPRG